MNKLTSSAIDGKLTGPPSQGCQVLKDKKAKFGHKQFQKRPNFIFLNFIKRCMFCKNFAKNRPKDMTRKGQKSQKMA